MSPGIALIVIGLIIAVAVHFTLGVALLAIGVVLLLIGR